MVIAAALPVAAMAKSVDFAVETAEEIAPVASQPTVVEVPDAESAALFAANPFSGGSGTAEDPYLLSTQYDLFNLATYVNGMNTSYASAYYQLANDVDLEGYDWQPIGTYTADNGYDHAFSGVFDGAGHTVSGFSVSSPDTRYIGFFGLIYNGSVKDLTIKDARFDYVYNGIVYNGVLAGRVLCADGKAHAITNCHAENIFENVMHISSVNYPLYTGGLIGYAHASDLSTLTVENCTSDAPMNVSASGNYSSGDLTIRAGGLIGYLAAIGNGKAEIKHNYALGDIFTYIDNAGTNKRNNNIAAGGLIGYAGGNTDGAIDISECYADCAVFAKACDDVYVGGFTSYTVSTASSIRFTDCFATGSLYTFSSGTDAYAAGFSAITGAQNLGSMTYENCYNDCDIFDLSSNNAVAGRFFAYSEGTINFENAYSLAENACAAVGHDDSRESILSAEQSTDLAAYGFDGDVWTIAESGYPYPVLRSLPLAKETYYLYLADGEGNVLDVIDGAFGDTYKPEPYEEPDGLFVFDYWSYLPADPDFLADTVTFDRDRLLFTNYSDEYRSFTIEFYHNSTLIDSVSLPYGSFIEFPTPPVQPDDAYFRYQFSHWSDGPDGETTIDPDTACVYGDQAFYAIYNKVSIAVWDGRSSSGFPGEGTDSSPYLISDGAALNRMRELVNEGNASYCNGVYELLNDIDLGGFEWTPIGTEQYPFSGTLYGKGFMITDFTITDNTLVHAGLFGVTNGAVIDGVSVSSFTIDVNNPRTDVTSSTERRVYAGGLIGYATSKTKDSRISRIYTSGSVTLNGTLTYAGGMIGRVDMTRYHDLPIDNCYSTASVASSSLSSSYVGGLVGSFYSYYDGKVGIDHCYYTGTLSASSQKLEAYAGGIAAYIFDDEDQYASGSSATDASLLASSVGTVRNCFAEATVNASGTVHSYGGAIYGNINQRASIRNCHKSASSSITAEFVNEKSNMEVRGVLATNLKKQTYLADTVGFDFEEIWQMASPYPVLQIGTAPRNIYRVEAASLNADKGSVDVTIRLCRFDVEDLVILAAAYDERGAMLRFEVYTVDDPAEVNLIRIEFSDLAAPSSFTAAVIDPETLSILETPVFLNA